MNDRKPIPLGTVPYEKGYVAGQGCYYSRRGCGAVNRNDLLCVIPQEFVGGKNEDEYRAGFFDAVDHWIKREMG